jgi:sulfite exporter TauE/SafE
MCGPLTLALHRAAGSRRAGAFALHQLGRISVYVAAGVASGLAGRAAGLAGLGRAVAIAAGLWLLLRAVRPKIAEAGDVAGLALGQRVGRLGAAAARALDAWPCARAFVLGGVNGLLPCGMVYAALAAAIALGSPARGALFMAGFGAGSTPALAAALAAGAWGGRLVPRAGLAMRVALIVLGAALVIQGSRAGAAAGSASAVHHHHVP